MVGGISQCLVGIQNYSENLDKRNPLQSHLWHRGVIPVKVGITSIKREAFHEENSNNQLKVNLDCLDKVRNGASNIMTKYQQKMADYYNKRVKQTTRHRRSCPM